MMQTEDSKPTLEDRHELEFQIECLEMMIDECRAEGIPEKKWIKKAYELRRLRRMR